MAFIANTTASSSLRALIPPTQDDFQLVPLFRGFRSNTEKVTSMVEVVSASLQFCKIEAYSTKLKCRGKSCFLLFGDFLLDLGTLSWSILEMRNL